jgi:hypothetical protein
MSLSARAQGVSKASVACPWASSCPIVAELHADSLEAFDRVLGRIRPPDGISHTETSLLLSTYKC